MAIKVKVDSGTPQVIPNAKEIQSRIQSLLETPPLAWKITSTGQLPGFVPFKPVTKVSSSSGSYLMTAPVCKL